MLFIKEPDGVDKSDILSLRLLATLGDAVINLFEKERALLSCSSAKQMHNLAAERLNAKAQCQFLEQISEDLTDQERDLIRRARNLKTKRYGKTEQAIYRQATAFEVLIGYLYLAKPRRLRELLELIDALRIDN
jgi:ribonuclease-3 family protein